MIELKTNNTSVTVFTPTGETLKGSYDKGYEQGYKDGAGSIDITEETRKAFNEGLEEGKPLGKLELLQDSEYMNAKVSGTAIAVNDVSPIEHSVGCRVASKNMFDISKIPTTSQVINNGDGTLTVKGIGMPTNRKLSQVCPNLKVGDIAVISLRITNSVQDGKNAAYIYLYGVNETWQTNRTKIITQEMLDSVFFVYAAWWTGDGSTDGVTSGTVSEIQVELGTTVTPYTPYVEELGGIEVSRYGKNLYSNVYADYADTNYKSLYIANEPLTMSFTDKDTSVDISGCYIGFTVNPNNVNEGYRWVIENGTVKSANQNDAAQNGKQCPYVFIYPNDENTFNKLMQRFYIQVELGNTSTEFEPYKLLQKITANADGTVDGIRSLYPSMTLLTNNNGAAINCNYLRDIDTYIDNVITNVALTGGEN